MTSWPLGQQVVLSGHGWSRSLFGGKKSTNTQTDNIDHCKMKEKISKYEIFTWKNLKVSIRAPMWNYSNFQFFARRFYVDVFWPVRVNFSGQIYTVEVKCNSRRNNLRKKNFKQKNHDFWRFFYQKVFNFWMAFFFNLWFFRQVPHQLRRLESLIWISKVSIE